jgi:imidazole glycerol-phosphate synthase subunit HisH
MMGKRVTVIDYGVGNLYSVQRAVEYCGGGDVVVSADVMDIESAERVILPGVGAFHDGMLGLRERGLIEPITAYARSGRPLLGICLGMQMLATQSEEFGIHAGLDLIAGSTVAIPRQSTQDLPLKVPFIGWTPIVLADGEVRSGSSLEAHPHGSCVYLVHSFHFQPQDPSHLLATYDFGGHRITAAVRKDNVTGFQFHPEKSGQVGLDIMNNFVARG